MPSSTNPNPAIATRRLPPIAPPGTRRFKTVVMGRGRRDSRRRRFYTVLYAVSGGGVTRRVATGPASRDKLRAVLRFRRCCVVDLVAQAAQAVDAGRRAAELALTGEKLDGTNFDNLIAKPDAEYEIAFRLFDVEGTGLIKFDNFLKMYDMHKGGDPLPSTGVRCTSAARTSATQ
ncbi:mitochondrial aspartate-glutamate transporter agc1 [Neofusicoccum ribis]|uniref:Mitochondrial aspartate-glutamate transporter agc1 n=1 Tax=Neofusicoccum ribis TaxID=45134 RepID=A0ABR3SD51_9PEZI